VVTHLHFLHWSLLAEVVLADDLTFQQLYRIDQVWQMVAQVEAVLVTVLRIFRIHLVVPGQLQGLQEELELP
jgi:hypothetical protein